MEGLASHVSESILRIGLNVYWPRRFNPNPPLSAGPFLLNHYRRPPKRATFYFSKFRERIAMSRVLDNGMVHLLTRVAPMIRKEYEYRRNAIVSVELARRTASPADKAHLLKLAEAWLDLAKLTRTQSGQRGRKIGEHPLVIAKLGDRDQRAA